MCLTCSIIKGDIIPVGGIIHKDDNTVLHHCMDQNIPGYLILSPVRHVESYGDLSQTDILHMGMIMKLAVNALKKIDGVEKVYVAHFGEETAHFHMHIFPRYKWMLTHSADDICTDHKIDGAKLLSFCRQQYKTRPELMAQDDILAVVEHVRTQIAAQTHRHHFEDEKL